MCVDQSSGGTGSFPGAIAPQAPVSATTYVCKRKGGGLAVALRIHTYTILIVTYTAYVTSGGARGNANAIY